MSMYYSVIAFSYVFQFQARLLWEYIRQL